ncbi:S66 peptidase family protein [Viridibacillus sp. FSL H8-0123]|uniref:S66 family peptidase n=1 Tax=Viridibacillus sp. FSL H8-0123 TaxID=1928922 RepID=UPI00096CFB83|nr:S66 peptidase family protein [Viridibacillus sp. FSL H8-0123]OMC81784.1 LD-carboxypeptidase [Viridibacillus sp. FSL H8-0123]
MIAPKLKKGDEIRIIAPSRSMQILSKDGIQEAIEQLEKMGLKVTFGEHVYDCDLHYSSSIHARVEDLHAAFIDPNVKGVLTVIGGFNANEILPYINYELIKTNPKILCGYSDIKALAWAITAKTGLVTYSGPHFSSFGMRKAQDYQTTYFKKCFMQDEAYEIEQSVIWSDDAWFRDQDNRNLIPNEGLKIYNGGLTNGTLYGGNLCTLNLLQGTEFMPDLKDVILFIEDDELTDPLTFARDFTSLLQQGKLVNLKGLVIGKFQNKSQVTEEHLHFIFDKHPILKNIPVMYNASFGHIQPMFTFPIGGLIEIDTDKKSIKIIEH